MKIGCNDFVRVKLTRAGRRAIVDHNDRFNDHIRRNRPDATFRAEFPKEDAEGCIRGQFWTIMSYFENEKWSLGGELFFEWMEPA